MRAITGVRIAAKGIRECPPRDASRRATHCGGESATKIRDGDRPTGRDATSSFRRLIKKARRADERRGAVRPRVNRYLSRRRCCYRNRPVSINSPSVSALTPIVRQIASFTPRATAVRAYSVRAAHAGYRQKRSGNLCRLFASHGQPVGGNYGSARGRQERRTR